MLCSRSKESGIEAANLIRASSISESGRIDVVQLDLESLHSIKDCADKIIKKYEHIDILVTNAGIMALPSLEYTNAGFEKQIG